MIAALLTVLVAAPTPVPTVFLHLVPGRSEQFLSSSKLLSMMAGELEPRSSLEIWPPERAGVEAARLEACPIEALYGCWYRQVRAAGGAAPRFLVVIIEAGGPDVADLRLLFLDLEDADRAARELGIDTGEVFEDRVYRSAMQAPSIAVERSDDAVAAAIKTFVERDIATVLRRTNHWGARAGIAVVPPPVEKVSTTSMTYTASLYASAGAAVIGVVLVAVAAASADDRLGCIASPTSDASACDSVAPATISPSNGASIGQSPSAPLFAPGNLGAGLLGLGAVVAGVAVAAYDRHETPWWAWVTGVVGGVLTFGLATALSNR